MTGNDATFLAQAHVTRRGSTCSRGKVGCVIASPFRGISVTRANGCNPGDVYCDDPRLGCNLEGNVHHPECRRVIHAEAYAVAACAQGRFSTVGAICYCTHSPCVNCSKLLVAAGIARFVYTTPYRIIDGLHYLQENGVICEQQAKPAHA